jgi:protein-tyrosine-phosphatase
MLGRRVYIESAGLRKAQRDPFALAVLREVGFEFSDDQPKTLDEVGFDGFDLIITLSQEARMVVAERARAVAAELLHWSIDDPTLGEGSREARLQAYRVVRERLRVLLKEQIVPRIRKTP